jgi:spore coat protein CotH
MKKYRLYKITGSILAGLILALGLAGCGGITGQAADNDTAPFYDDRVVTVRIVMAEGDWEDMQANARAEEYERADFWCDGELVPDVAVRPKGNSSLMSVSQSGSPRMSLKVDFNFFNSARDFYGLKKINLNNGFSDPTLIREALSYDIFAEMGIPTPRTGFVDLWVNDTHLGVYTMVEQIDTTFLSNNFDDATGNLYKPEMPAAYLNWTEADLPEDSQAGAAGDGLDVNLGGGKLAEIMDALGLGEADEDGVTQAPRIMQFGERPAGDIPRPERRPGDMPWGDWQDGEVPPEFSLPEGNEGAFRQFVFPGMTGAAADYLEGMALKTNENNPDYSGLFKFLNVLNNEPEATFVQEIEKVLDVDQVLRYLAVSTVLVHLDNYIGMGHNYYLYEVDGRFTIIPWDLNMSFGGFNLGVDREAIIDFYIDEPTIGAVADRPLVARLLAVPAYLEAYHSYLEELIDGPFSPEAMADKIDALADLIRPYVQGDTLKFYTTAEFERALGEDVATGMQVMGMGINIGLKALVAQRVDSIRKQLDGVLPSTNNGQGNGSGMGMMGVWNR